MQSGQTVLFYDGVCSLCSRSVQYVIRHDKKRIFRFADLNTSMGSEAKKIVQQTTGKNTDSIIVLDKGHYYVKADAVLFILKKLRKFSLLRLVSFFVPGIIRNAVYDIIARNRYRWFGQSCIMIDEKTKAQLFL